MIELLAPAGDIEKIEFAFLYGADAIYFGGQNFSLRANAKNFSIEDIKKATMYAHNLGKKVYVTVNIIFHNEDLEGLEEYLKDLNKIGIDGIIASDIIVFSIVQRLNLNLKLIVSTQASVLNHEAAKFYKNLGVGQIVLAREALKDDIKRIKDETSLDLECFIHGAMCTSISGQCTLSNNITLRDSNRGGCAQICRWVFNEDDEYPFTISSKDLNNIKNVKEMIDLGVNTFKIEGRMRSIYYIASVVNAYRNIIDKTISNTLTDDEKNYYLKVLNRVANRESAPQFFEKLPDENDEYFSLDDEASNQDFLGIIKDYDESERIAIIEQRNYFKKGDTIEIFGPKTNLLSFIVNEIYDENNDEIDVANKPKMIVKIPLNFKVNKNDILRVKLD